MDIQQYCCWRVAERTDGALSARSAGTAGGVSGADGSGEGGKGESVWEVVRHHVESRMSYRVTAQELHQQTGIYDI